MVSYYNSIIDILESNVGISRGELFVKSGYTSKRLFLNEINSLLASGRIQCYHDRLIFSPRVLYLVELDFQKSKLFRKIELDYLPPEVLRKELNFIEKGPEFEDDLEYFLQIAGLELNSCNQSFIENHCKQKLDFANMKYDLWSTFKNPKEKMYIA
mgnify:CR=1 FL=1